MTIEAIPNLRPMKMGQILDQAVRLYRHNFISFIGIVALVQIPVAIIQVLVNLATFPYSSLSGIFFLGPLISTVISFIFIQGIGAAAMTRAVADNYLGEKTAAIEAYRKIGRTWLSLLAALFVVGLLIIVAGFWWLVPCIGWITGLGIIFYLSFVIVPLVVPTIVLEGQNARSAWRRAWDLARGRFWWVLGFFIVLYIFNMLVVIGPSLLINILLAGLAEFSALDPETAFTIQTISQQLVAMGFSLIFLPFQLAATTLVYFDLRVRSEGFDLALKVQDMGDEKPMAAELTAAPPQTAQGSLVTSRELAYFAGLSLVPFTIYIAIVAFIFVIALALEMGSV